MNPLSRGEWLIAGTALTVVLCLVAMICAFMLTGVDNATGLLAFMIASLTMGRETGMVFGSTMGLAPWSMGLVYTVQSLAMGLLVYSLVVYLLSRGSQGRWGGFASRMQAFAERKKGSVERWGPVGVFAFMMVPFILNGPHVGAMLGRLCGLDTRRIMVPVVTATVVNAAAWSFFTTGLMRHLEGVADGARFIPFAVLTAIVVAAGVAGKVKAKAKRRRFDSGAVEVPSTRSIIAVTARSPGFESEPGGPVRIPGRKNGVIPRAFSGMPDFDRLNRFNASAIGDPVKVWRGLGGGGSALRRRKLGRAILSNGDWGPSLLNTERRVMS